MCCKYSLKCHIVFCVKYRKKLLSRKHIADTTKETITGCKTDNFHIQVMEVDKDHIHLLVDYTPGVSVAQIVRLLKQFWKEQVFWSSGYFVCSTGDASSEVISQYIAEQG